MPTQFPHRWILQTLAWHWVAGLLLASCATKGAAAPARDLDREVMALLQGLGPTQACQDDRGCKVGSAAGACGLGTCFGLLTTDQRPLRKVLVQRIATADPVLRDRLGRKLLTLAQRTDGGNALRLATLEGLGAVWHGDGCKNAEIEALVVAQVQDEDPRQAIVARLIAGSCGHAAALPGLLEDLATGTEQLRAESAVALAGYRQGQPAAAAKAALLQLLHDPSPVVIKAAAVALASRQAQPDVAAALQALTQDRAPHLGYLLQRQAADKEVP